MHWTPHSSLGVAIIVFYSPTLLASIYLWYAHGSPRMAWFFMALMCCIRIASGVLVILYKSGGHFHTDLSTSASIMLGVGVFPMIFAIVGWLYILENLEPDHVRKWFRWCLIGIRVFGVTALAVVIAGSIMLGPLDESASGLRAGAGLVKAGALLVVAIHAWCIGILATQWVEMIRSKFRSRTAYFILAMLSLSAVLLILRVAYMCLVIFDGGPSSMWNPLDGSLDVLVRLSLLPEYVIIVLMIACGLWLLRRTKGSGCHGGQC